MVGGYIFLAGISGASSLLTALLDVAEGRPAADTVRRGRYLALLAPTLGSALLVWDLHTPHRFMNMMRIARRTSPMSIGTWVLTAFTGFAGISAAAQFGADRLGADAPPPVGVTGARRAAALARPSVLARLLGGAVPAKVGRTLPAVAGRPVPAAATRLAGATRRAVAERLPAAVPPAPRATVGRWPARLLGVARAAHVPAGLLGMGLSTYTAALLSATSTPLWAAAPRALAARFGSSAVATGAAALSLLERRGRRRRRLDAVMLAALGVELVAARAGHAAYRRAGIAAALDGGWGTVERVGATDLGTVLPLGVGAACLLAGRRMPAVALLAALGGGLLLRVSVMGAGDTSAERPEISMRFAQPDNLDRKA